MIVHGLTSTTSFALFSSTTCTILWLKFYVNYATRCDHTKLAINVPEKASQPSPGAILLPKIYNTKLMESNRKKKPSWTQL